MEPEGMEKAWTRKARIIRARITAIIRDSPYSRQKGFFGASERAPASFCLIDGIMKDFQERQLRTLRVGRAALIHRAKLVLGSPANGTDPIRRQFVKGGVGRHVVIRVSYGRIIDVATNLTLVLFHDFLLSSMV
jgi:hypothetical protein